MAEKILNTRIQLKYDTFAKWQDSAVVLKAGELAIAYLGEVKDPSTAVQGDNVNQNPVLFKVGDGSHTFKDLPFASALAADVYAWAKKAGITVADNGTGKFVTDLTWDANTNSLVLSRADVDWADIKNKVNASSSVDGLMSKEDKAKLDSISSADGKVANAGHADTADNATNAQNAEEAEHAAEADHAANADNAKEAEHANSATSADSAKKTVGTLKILNESYNGSVDVEVTADELKVGLGLGSAAYTDSSAYDAAGSADAAKDAAIADAATKYATIKAAEDAQSAADSANAKIDAFMADDAKVEGAIDTLVEINKYITDDTAAFTALSNRVTSLENGSTPAKEAEHADVASELDASGIAQVKAIKVDNAVNADKLGNVAASEYALKTDAQGYANTAEQNAKGYADGLAKNYATAAQGAKADTAVQSATFAGKEMTKTGDALSISQADARTALGLKSAAYTESSAYATAAQGAKADSALQSIEAGTGLKVSAVANNKQTIDIDESVTFVFNCGSATELVD